MPFYVCTPYNDYFDSSTEAEFDAKKGQLAGAASFIITFCL